MMRIDYEAPNEQCYIELRKKTGQAAVDASIARKALSHSTFMVGIWDENSNKLAGMGRVVGDGALCFQVADLLVDPDYANQGIDKLVMEEMIQYLNENAGIGASVVVITELGLIPLYKAYGFELTYPNAYSMKRIRNG
ncbi:GNAT family N-acetyltransferase [Paenibacillus gorillae]|uniref:GNAT family N-acetyltransferase n=1 Tax=Paenibacillus gorillae TaxID=1243662 RepID=UPI0004BB23C8|nr:GNAT family N-acetyltransferase [Paenibacillus gorillae]